MYCGQPSQTTTCIEISGRNFCFDYLFKQKLQHRMYSNPFASMIFGPREKSCYSKIMLWKSATKNFYSVIISHYTRENFYSVIISHYTREKCNHKKFQCYISLLMYIHTDKIFVKCICLKAWFFLIIQYSAGSAYQKYW